ALYVCPLLDRGASPSSRDPTSALRSDSALGRSFNPMLSAFKQITCALTCALLTGSAALAAPGGQSTGQQPIVVQADPIDTALERGRTGSASIVRMQGAGRPGETLPGVLEREASVRVDRFGGRGSYSTISLRGSNPNQVNVMLDG